MLATLFAHALRRDWLPLVLAGLASFAVSFAVQFVFRNSAENLLRTVADRAGEMHSTAACLFDAL